MGNKDTNKEDKKKEYREGYKTINSSNGSYYLDKNGNVKFSTKHSNNC
jgi:hypothetical protein